MVSPTKAPLKKPITVRQSILDSKPANEGAWGQQEDAKPAYVSYLNNA